jgi:hypothetical protein
MAAAEVALKSADDLQETNPQEAIRILHSLIDSGIFFFFQNKTSFLSHAATVNQKIREQAIYKIAKLYVKLG